MKHLVLGGARSGKSRWAEIQVLAQNKQPFYVATGVAGDLEMEQRIAHHRRHRGNEWQLIEEPICLADALKKLDNAANVLLVDCLTLWISNCLHFNCFESERQKLLDVIGQSDADIVMVSNEVGSGIIPLGEVSRRFVDESGWLHQKLAQLCDRVTLVVAGLPLALKS